MITIGELDYN